MKYKHIKSVAHSFAQSFTSTLNHVAGDYVIAHLARAAAAHDATELSVDLITGAVSPEIRVVEPVRQSLEEHRRSLPRLLRSQNVDPDAIVRAVMVVRFDPALLPPPERAGSAFTLRYRCAVEMIDDRGKLHVGGVEDCWPTAELDERAWDDIDERARGTPPTLSPRPLLRHLFPRRG